MKRVLISLAIILLLGGFSVYGTYVITTDGNALSDMLDTAISQAESGDMEAAHDTARAIEDSFVAVEKRLSYFIDHSIISQLGVDISQLYYLAEADDPSEFCAHCRSAKITVTHIIDSERPTLPNIL